MVTYQNYRGGPELYLPQFCVARFCYHPILVLGIETSGLRYGSAYCRPPTQKAIPPERNRRHIKYVPWKNCPIWQVKLATLEAASGRPKACLTKDVVSMLGWQGTKDSTAILTATRCAIPYCMHSSRRTKAFQHLAVAVRIPAHAPRGSYSKSAVSSCALVLLCVRSMRVLEKWHT